MGATQQVHAVGKPPIALSPAAWAQAIAAATTVYPYVVAATFLEGNQHHLEVKVEWAAAGTALAAEDLVPEGAEFIRGEVFPAAKLLDLGADQRRAYGSHYRELLMALGARALGKARADLKPWADFDPVAIDEQVQRWLKPGIRFSGD